MEGSQVDNLMAMFISIYNILPSLQSLPSILLLSIILILTWKWSKKRENFKGEGRVIPPGSLGLPLLGETMNLISAYKTEHPDPFIDDRVKLHGSKLFTSHIFGERTIFSTDPDFNRVVLRGEGRIFEASYPSSITTLLGRHSLSIIKGAPHKRMHALTMGWFSSVSVLRNSLLPEIESLVRNVLCAWKEGEVLLLLDQTKKITFDLTVKQLVSHDPGEWTETLRSEYLRLINGFFSIPFPSFLSFTTYGRAIQARKKVAGMLREVVRKRKDERSKREVNNDDNDQMDYNNDWQNIKRRTSDILDELIEAEEGYTEEEMVDFLLSLLVAGYETTPTIMTLVVKFLTETPLALSLLKEEHEEIKARKKKIDNEHLEWSDYKAMPFTQCVINETLRVVNIVSGVFRRATTDVHFKGYTIPEGCKVFASFRAVHLDQEYFEDARSFNPFRWQNSKESGLFTPFGGGPRLCPGYELARVEISVFLHHLITRFSWDVVEQDRLVFFPTTRLLKGYPIIVHQKEH